MVLNAAEPGRPNRHRFGFFFLAKPTCCALLCCCGGRCMRSQSFLLACACATQGGATREGVIYSPEQGILFGEQFADMASHPPEEQHRQRVSSRPLVT